jgi:type VI protein secretion system component VasK
VAFLANNIVTWFASNDQRSFDETFNALKIYLMLVEPQHRDMEFMSGWLAENPVTGTDAEVGAELARQLTNLYALKKIFH